MSSTDSPTPFIPKKTLDRWGHVAYFFVFLGVFCLANELQIGWAFRFMGEIGWILIGFGMRMSSVWSWGIGFAILDAIGYFMWS